MAAIAAAILMLQWPLRELGFGLLSGESGVEAAGRDYFDARVWGAPATLCNFVLMGWFLGRAESRHVLVMTVVGNLGNIALNYLFIVRMGLAAYGAGLATSGVLVYKLLSITGRDTLTGAPESWQHSTDLLSPFIYGPALRFSGLTEGFWQRLPGGPQPVSHKPAPSRMTGSSRRAG